MSLLRRRPHALALLSVVALVACAGGRNVDAERPLNPAPTFAPTSVGPGAGAPDASSTTSPPTASSAPDAGSTTVAPIGSTATTVDAAASSGRGPEIVGELVLRSVGIGEQTFGAPADDAVRYLTEQLGAPTVDSGWLDSADAPYGACPGPRVRVVQWGQLQLYFGDESEVSVEPGHFFYYSYGAFTGLPPAPEGLVTEAGIGIGSTLAEVRSAYPEAREYDDPLYGAGFIVTDGGISGTLTDATEIGRVTVLFGGIGCGE